MTRPIPPLALVLAIATAGVGCDTARQAVDDAADKAKADAASKSTGDATAKPTGGAASKAKSEAEPAKPKLLGCDQRDFIPPGDKKLAEQIGKSAKPRLTCVDYGNRKEGRSPSCIEGTALETPCPSEKVVATCTLAATGVVCKYYDGIVVTLAEKGCQTLEGTFAKT